MSYAEAKEIALLRIALRAHCTVGDRATARAALLRLTQLAGDDDALLAEVTRWRVKLDSRAS